MLPPRIKICPLLLCEGVAAKASAVVAGIGAVVVVAVFAAAVVFVKATILTSDASGAA